MSSRVSTKKRRVSETESNSDGDILAGLNLNRTGEYVKIDINLIERLQKVRDSERNEEEDQDQRQLANPFEDAPEFLETLQNGTPLTLDFLQSCSDKRKRNRKGVQMGEIVANLPVDWLALKRSGMTEDDWNYSHTLSVNPRVTNQQSSGRCWLYSALGTLRYQIMKKFNLDYKFEFSETYLYFYDKIERSNLFLEYLWTLRDRETTDRDVRLFTDMNTHLLHDGGTFTYFLNLVRKYGLVPKNVYCEAYNSMSSHSMNETLMTVLNHMYLEFSQQGWTRAKFDQKKKAYMTTIYDLVVRFLGEPPKPTDTFKWTFKDANGTSQTVPNLTPEKFYRTVVPHENETKVTIINDPRHPETYYQNSFGEYALNVVGATPSYMINLPLDEFKKLISESIQGDEGVWFGADIGKCFDYESNTSDTNRFDYKSVLGTDIEFEKGEMLEMLTATPNHAMVFNGVDTVQDADQNITGYKKWRVENSWGLSSDLESAEDFGYYRMMDDYVSKYVYMAVVDLKYFDQPMLEKIMENANQGNTFTYSAYDAFGTLALRAPCKHCSEKCKHTSRNSHKK